CPTGSIQGLDSNTCYRFISDKLNWYDAERACITYGGHLTSISSSLENSFVSNKAGSIFNNGQNFWLGSNNFLVRFNWTWSDVTTFTYTNWAKGNFLVISQNFWGQWCNQGTTIPFLKFF